MCELYCVLSFLKVIPSHQCFNAPCLLHSCPHSSLHLPYTFSDTDTQSDDNSIATLPFNEFNRCHSARRVPLWPLGRTVTSRRKRQEQRWKTLAGREVLTFRPVGEKAVGKKPQAPLPWISVLACFPGHMVFEAHPRPTQHFDTRYFSNDFVDNSWRNEHAWSSNTSFSSSCAHVPWILE